MTDYFNMTGFDSVVHFGNLLTASNDITGGILMVMTLMILAYIMFSSMNGKGHSSSDIFMTIGGTMTFLMLICVWAGWIGYVYLMLPIILVGIGVMMKLRE